MDLKNYCSENIIVLEATNRFIAISFKVSMPFFTETGKQPYESYGRTKQPE